MRLVRLACTQCKDDLVVPHGLTYGIVRCESCAAQFMFDLADSRIVREFIGLEKMQIQQTLPPPTFDHCDFNFPTIEKPRHVEQPRHVTFEYHANTYPPPSYFSSGEFFTIIGLGFGGVVWTILLSYFPWTTLIFTGFVISFWLVTKIVSSYTKNGPYSVFTGSYAILCAIFFGISLSSLFIKLWN